MAEKRTRNFATVVYPESAPENWMDILNDYHVPAFVSPLHEFDFNATGETKKAHYHVMVMYDNVKSNVTHAPNKICFNLNISTTCPSFKPTEKGYSGAENHHARNKLTKRSINERIDKTNDRLNNRLHHL